MERSGFLRPCCSRSRAFSAVVLMKSTWGITAFRRSFLPSVLRVWVGKNTSSHLSARNVSAALSFGVLMANHWACDEGIGLSSGIVSCVYFIHLRDAMAGMPGEAHHSQPFVCPAAAEVRISGSSLSRNSSGGCVASREPGATVLKNKLFV